MLGTKGYWYKIGKNPLKRRACMLCADGNSYTVYLDKYIEDSDGYLYKLMDKKINGGIWVTGANGMSYYTENTKIDAKCLTRPDHFDEYLCQKSEIPQPKPNQQQRPSPRFNFPNGDGSANCNDKGVCEVDAPEGAKVDIIKPKGWDVKTNGKKYWLNKQK